jgi:hypothetical protein
MCYSIEPSFILGHFLKGVANEKCTIQELSDLKNVIEKKIDNVYIDICKESLLNAISCYSSIFKWEENENYIECCIKTSKKYDKDSFICFFNNSKEIGENIKKMIKNYEKRRQRKTI